MSTPHLRTRGGMIETITHLDTNEVVSTSPISSSEARAGANWIPDFGRDVCELIHPDEPGTILDTREISDDERQLSLDGDEDEPAPKKRAPAKRSAKGASPL